MSKNFRYLGVRLGHRLCSLTATCLLAGVVLMHVTPAFAFGPTGHRVVGHVAEQHLSARAQRAIVEILGKESLARASTWPDEIRSDPRWDHAKTWHFVTIEDGETYESSVKNPAGDIIEAIERFVTLLEDPAAEKEDKVIALRWLVHLVGDLHQPLHVGRGADRGGNLIKAEWFGEKTNIHAVWDSKLIDSTKLSYTELAEFVDTATPLEVRQWQASGVLDWAQESIDQRDNASKVPEPTFGGSYGYAFLNTPIVERRLSQAGVRLAGLLNEIFSRGAAPLASREAAPAPRAELIDVAADDISEKERRSLATLGGTLWTQRGEEYRGVSISAYHQASQMLKRALADPNWTALPATKPPSPRERERIAALPPAIILDVDETVLDNSPYQAWLIKHKTTYESLTWNRWVAAARAKPIPGAVEFIDFAREQGVTIFYVTNRHYRGDLDENDNGSIEPQEKNRILEPFTIDNLRAVGLLPQEGLSDKDALMLLEEKPNWTSEKTSRRLEIAKHYRVLLLLGDSLGDFSGYDFGNRIGSLYDLDEETRRVELRKHRHRWGTSWIVLPNATYGSWLPREPQAALDALDVWDGSSAR